MSQKKDDKKSNEGGSGLGGFLTFVGGSLVGAALAYGAVKLGEYVQEQEREQMMAGATGDQGANEKQNQPKNIDDDNDNDFDERRPARDTPGPSVPPEYLSSDPGATSSFRTDVLLERLVDFHRIRLRVPNEVISEISENVEKIKLVLQQVLSEELGGNVCLNIPTDVMSLLSVSQCLDLNVSLTLPLAVELDENSWEFSRAEDGSPGYFKVSKINPDKPHVADPWLAGNFLNREVVRKTCARVIRKTSIWDGLAEIESNADDDIPTMKLLLQSKTGQKYCVKIVFQPACKVGSKILAADKEKASHDLSVWKQNFSAAHTYPRLNLLQIKCIQILAAVSVTNQTELGFVTMEMLHSLVLHVTEMEDNWDEVALSERFIDLLKGLEEYCQHRQLSHFFMPQWNLLEGVDSGQLQMATEFISRHIGRNTLHHLLP